MLEMVRVENNGLTFQLYKLTDKVANKNKIIKDTKEELKHLKNTSEVLRLESIVKDQKKQLVNLESCLKKEIQYKTTACHQ